MDLTAPAPLSLSSLAINMVLGIMLSLAIAWYYTRYGQSLSNRALFAPILPILTLITVLVISVVKSSLALSLGLVGALSIVRFRTAIKDPEELIYLFFAIAVGLGLGADQRIPTLIAVGIIVIYLLARTFMVKRKAPENLYLNIHVTEEEDQHTFSALNDTLLQTLPAVDLRRLDSQNGTLQATYYVSISDQTTMVTVLEALKSRFPQSSISFVEQNNLLGG